MQLQLKDVPLLDIRENGTCAILDFDRLPFALRKENVTFVDFAEWASNRTLSIGRSFAKEILNTLRLSQTRKEAVTLYEAAAAAQKELGMELGILDEMERPGFLRDEQWEGVLERKRKLKTGNDTRYRK